MAFTIDNTEAKNESGLLPIGDYEVVISDVVLLTNRNDKTSIQSTLIIRNDLDQAYKNKHIWYRMWKRKNPTEGDCKVGGFSINQIQSLSKAAKLENGVSYDTLDDWFAALKNKPVLVTIKHTEYNGKLQFEVSYINESKFLKCEHVYKDAGKGDAAMASLDLDDSELPF